MGACEAGSNLPLIELAYTLIETSFCSGHSVVLPCFDLVNGVSVARIRLGRVSFEIKFSGLAGDAQLARLPRYNDLIHSA